MAYIPVPWSFSSPMEFLGITLLNPTGSKGPIVRPSTAPVRLEVVQDPTHGGRLLGHAWTV